MGQLSLSKKYDMEISLLHKMGRTLLFPNHITTNPHITQSYHTMQGRYTKRKVKHFNMQQSDLILGSNHLVQRTQTGLNWRALCILVSARYFPNLMFVMTMTISNNMSHISGASMYLVGVWKRVLKYTTMENQTLAKTAYGDEPIKDKYF